MTITKFDKRLCNTLREEVAAALQPFADKHDITLIQHGGSYDDMAWLTKIEFKVKETTDGKRVEQAEFEKYCDMYYCKPEDYGKTLTINGKKFAFIGFAVSRSKFPIKVRNAETGKVHLYVKYVLRQIDRMPPWEREEKAEPAKAGAK